MLARYIICVINMRIMKNQIEQIIEILKESENKLRDVIAESAQRGDYRIVDTARAIAVNIHDLHDRISDPSRPTMTFKIHSESKNTIAPRKPKHTSKNSVRSNYPKYEVRNGSLIKIGWSKKQRREYSHKVPSSVFDLTIRTMTALAKNGAGPFTAEHIIDKVNDMEVEVIPAYQVYVVIAMLRKANCIKQLGREGYNIPTDVTEKAQEAWRKLSNNMRKSKEI